MRYLRDRQRVYGDGDYSGDGMGGGLGDGAKFAFGDCYRTKTGATTGSGYISDGGVVTGFGRATDCTTLTSVTTRQLTTALG